MLLRAFGPWGRSADSPTPSDRLTPSGPPSDPVVLFERAERLSLSVRIASRAAGWGHSAPAGLPIEGALEEELGAEVAARFRAARRAAAARDAQLEALAVAVAQAAQAVETAEVPVVLLKYGGLRGVGALPGAGRLAADLDLLVRPSDAPVLRDALLAGGWHGTGLPGWEHHLPALRHPGLGEVEIHDRLPGLTVPGEETGGTAVGYDELSEREVLGPTAWPASGSAERPWRILRVPARPVLLAHALVHGLVQHGWAPRSYPPFRAVSDWIDLGLGAEDDADLLAAAAPWLDGALPAEEVAAARRLCALLVAGRPEALSGDDPGAVLGRHLLAGALDPSYRRSLRLARLLPPPGTGARSDSANAANTANAPSGPSERDRSRLSSVLRSVGRALVPPAAELAALYGPWRTRGGLLWRRLIRPADLALRLVTAAASWLHGRWRGPARL